LEVSAHLASSAPLEVSAPLASSEPSTPLESVTD
jgi:hypothetical protein